MTMGEKKETAIFDMADLKIEAHAIRKGEENNAVGRVPTLILQPPLPMEESLRLFKDIDDGDDSFFNFGEQNSSHELSQEELGEILASSLRDPTPEPPPLLHPQTQPSFHPSFQDPQSSYAPTSGSSVDPYSLPVSHHGTDPFSIPSSQNNYFCDNPSSSIYESNGFDNGFPETSFANSAHQSNNGNICNGFASMAAIPTTSAVSSAMYGQPQPQIHSTTPGTHQGPGQNYPTPQLIQAAPSFHQSTIQTKPTVLPAQNIINSGIQQPQQQEILSNGLNIQQSIPNPPKIKAPQSGPLIIQQNGGSSLPLQVVNGQLVIQAQLQHIQTNNGVVAVAVLQPVQVQSMLQQQQGNVQQPQQGLRSQILSNPTVISSQSSFAQPSTSPLLIASSNHQLGNVTNGLVGVSPGSQQSNGLILAPSATPSSQSNAPSSSSKLKSRPLKPKPGAKKPGASKCASQNRGSFPTAQSIPQLAPAVPKETPGKLSIQLDPENARLVSQLNEQIDLLQSSANSTDPAIQETISRCQRERNAIFDAALQSQHGISASTVGQSPLPPPRPAPVQPTLVVPSGTQPRIVSMNGQSFMMVPSGVQSQGSPLPVQPLRVEPAPQQQYTSMQMGSNMNQGQSQEMRVCSNNGPQPGTSFFSGDNQFASLERQNKAPMWQVPHEKPVVINPEEERRKRREARLQTRRETLRQYKDADQTLLEGKCYESPFQDVGDTFARLMPFHLYDEEDLCPEFIAAVDEKQNQINEKLGRRKRELENRFRASKLKESSVTNPVWEECLVLNLMSWHEDDLLKMEQRLSKTNPDRLYAELKALRSPPPKPISPKSSPSQNSDRNESFTESEEAFSWMATDPPRPETPIPSPAKLEIDLPPDLGTFSPATSKVTSEDALGSPIHDSTSSTGTGNENLSSSEMVQNNCSAVPSKSGEIDSSRQPPAENSSPVASIFEQSKPLDSSTEPIFNSLPVSNDMLVKSLEEELREFVAEATSSALDPIRTLKIETPSLSQRLDPESSPLKLRVKLKRTHCEQDEGASASWVATNSIADSGLKGKKVKEESRTEEEEREESQHRKEKRRKQRRKEKEKRREERRKRAALKLEEERQLTIPKLRINLKNLLPGNTDLSSINLIPFTSCQETEHQRQNLKTVLPQALPNGLEASDSEDDEDDEEEAMPIPEQRKVSPLKIKPVKLTLKLPQNHPNPSKAIPSDLVQRTEISKDARKGPNIGLEQERDDDEEFSDEFPSSPCVSKSFALSEQKPSTNSAPMPTISFQKSPSPDSPPRKPIFSLLESDESGTDEGGGTKALINSALDRLETSERIDTALEGLNNDTRTWDANNGYQRWCGFNNRPDEAVREDYTGPRDPEASSAVGGILGNFSTSLYRPF